MKKSGGRRGITLIALVITIVVLLILAGITINLTIGQDGIITRAQEAGREYENAATSEREQLAELTNRTDEIITNVTGVNEPKEKIIEIELKGEKEQTTIPVNLSLEVKREGEKITNYKWVLNDKSEEIGIEEEKYTEEVLNDGDTELKISEAGTYYLHVLTTEENGIKKETVKGPISVNIYYHKHVGDADSGGGCYITPVYHSHTYCSYTQSNGTCTLSADSHRYNAHDGNGDYYCAYCPYGCDRIYAGRSYPCTITHSCPYLPKVTNYTCGKTTDIVEIYSLGCGKTEETIESVTIVY